MNTLNPDDSLHIGLMRISFVYNPCQEASIFAQHVINDNGESAFRPYNTAMVEAPWGFDNVGEVLEKKNRIKCCLCCPLLKLLDCFCLHCKDDNGPEHAACCYTVPTVVDYDKSWCIEYYSEEDDLKFEDLKKEAGDSGFASCCYRPCHYFMSILLSGAPLGFLQRCHLDSFFLRVNIHDHIGWILLHTVFVQIFILFGINIVLTIKRRSPWGLPLATIYVILFWFVFGSLWKYRAIKQEWEEMQLCVPYVLENFDYMY